MLAVLLSIAVLGVTLAVIAGLVLVTFKRGAKAVILLSAAVLVLGTALNYSLHYGTDVGASTFGLILYSFYNAVQMFFGDGLFDPVYMLANDLSMSALQFLKWILCMLAISITVSALILAIGSRASNYLKVFLSRPQKLYLVYGSSCGATALAYSLSEQQNQDDTRCFTAQIMPECHSEALFSGDSSLTRSENVSIFRDDSFLLKRTKGKTVSFFFFDDDDSEFLDGVLQTLAKCSSLTLDNAELYVFSDKKWIHEVLEHELGNQISFQIMNPAKLKARQLSAILQQHVPAEIQPKILGKVLPLRILILGGLGHTGIELLRSIIAGCQLPGYRLALDVVDTAVDAKAGIIESQFPEVHKVCDLRLEAFDVCSTDFQDILQDNHYDAIVIELGSDAANIETALSINNWYLLNGREETMPVIAVSADNAKGLEALTVNRKSIKFFGDNEMLFTKTSITDEELDRRAKLVNALYCLRGDKKSDLPLDISLRDKWNTDVKSLWKGLSPWHRESNRASADYYLVLNRLKKAYKELDPDDRQLILAQAEKQRWNAFHYANGFVTMSIEEMRNRFEEVREDANLDPSKKGRYARQDLDKHKRHVCLVGWDDLPKISEAYNALHPSFKEDYQETDKHIVEMPAIVSAEDAVARNQ